MKFFENVAIGEIFKIMDFVLIEEFSKVFFDGFEAHFVKSINGVKSDKFDKIFVFPGITVSSVFTEILHGFIKDSTPSNLSRNKYEK